MGALLRKFFLDGGRTELAGEKRRFMLRQLPDVASGIECITDGIECITDFYSEFRGGLKGTPKLEKIFC